MNGVESTVARIAQLQARFAALTVTSPARPAATRPTAGATAVADPGATFEQALATATAAVPATATAPAATTTPARADTAALTPARKLSPGAYGSLRPPAELAGYGNGRIPAGRLESLGVGNHQLWAPAATAFRQLTDAARRDGVTIGVNDSYRDFAGQERMAREKGLYSQGGLAAVPGTSSHGWGLAMDLQLDGRAQQWMRDNGHRFGFVEDVPREPWHWTYRPES
jgi:zinc D-Ala-D-Ala carboxypeptidase